MNIYMVKTNKECFISDCKVFSGSDYEYHRTQLTNLYFDGEKPKETYCKNWYVIDKYPEKIETESIEYTNERYEINNKNLICEKFPETIKKEDRGKFNFDITEFYTFKRDKLPLRLVEAENVNVEIIIELDSFKMPNKIEYDIVCDKEHYKNNSAYKITNANVKHQFLDKMIFPEIMLSSRPCKLTSKQMYDITRKYIKDNIDLSKAKITSDYKFCFAVKKIIPLLTPEKISYTNIFARTKKERNKIHHEIKEYKEVEIFSMTHKQENYGGYTAIDELCANNENELKEKVDTWLKGVVDIINKPLTQCEHCNGTGYIDEIKKIELNQN
ncbi:TPA: hypothetical protein KOR49_002195 [Clostridioides difficile]|uniref:hypothetical protein n=1 Tax=Clostridioides difficile TaxID=1496 RepID=UPI00016C6550|nr:hypothetical protein [Clostridioides difficile]EGT3945311.1 hypothetical protein [Clostridioides difficile]MBG0198949.1 hypothetical protein [Clostridioides difficile]MCA0574392.1 hypothetical protein [Clostridioides difficile]SJT14485.1 Uncharacterised protein [Clostridioides difficile]VHT46284.1 Uncharacterised protein [Clostridioides difficile]